MEIQVTVDVTVESEILQAADQKLRVSVLSFWGKCLPPSLALLLSPSTNWMKPTHLMEGDLF